jgi:hypothetical protein
VDIDTMCWQTWLMTVKRSPHLYTYGEVLDKLTKVIFTPAQVNGRTCRRGNLVQLLSSHLLHFASHPNFSDDLRSMHLPAGFTHSFFLKKKKTIKRQFVDFFQ